LIRIISWHHWDGHFICWCFEGGRIDEKVKILHNGFYNVCMIFTLYACSSRHSVERSFTRIDIESAPEEIQEWISGISGTDAASYIKMLENEDNIIIYLFVDSVAIEEGKAIKVSTVGIHSMGKNGLEIEVRYKESSENIDTLLEITAPKDQLEILHLKDGRRATEEIEVVVD
jgi:hypothetical protein